MEVFFILYQAKNPHSQALTGCPYIYFLLSFLFLLSLLIISPCVYLLDNRKLSCSFTLMLPYTCFLDLDANIIWLKLCPLLAFLCILLVFKELILGKSSDLWEGRFLEARVLDLVAGGVSSAVLWLNPSYTDALLHHLKQSKQTKNESQNKIACVMFQF